MNLNVVLAGREAHGWQLLLEQIGLPLTDGPSGIWEDHKVLILPEGNEAISGGRVLEFIGSGGGVLCSANSFEKMTGVASRGDYIRWLGDGNDPIFGTIGPVDLFKECRFSSHANCLNSTHSQTSFVGPYGRGFVVVLPFDAGMIYADDRSMRKSFYASQRRLPHERVATVSRNGVREIVTRALEILYHHQGLPFVHKWYYPEQVSSLFGIRIDTDYAARADIVRLYEVLRDRRVPATWFIDLKSHVALLEYFKGMTGHELALHCYEHSTYPDAVSNARNIAEGLRILRDAEIQPDGFAAPFGIWHEQIGTAIRESGFAYSSEFSYDYDNLPSFPLLGNAATGVLQVPIHPISIGSLRRQGFNQNQMKSYFASTMGRNSQHHRPVFFYHHPRDGNEPVLHSIIDEAQRRDLKVLTLGEYARWWKQRTLWRPTFEIDGDVIRTSASTRGDVWMHLTLPDGREGWTAPKNELRLSELQWKEKAVVEPLPPDYRRIYQFNPWIYVNRVEDRLSRFALFQK